MCRLWPVDARDVWKDTFADEFGDRASVDRGPVLAGDGERLPQVEQDTVSAGSDLDAGAADLSGASMNGDLHLC